MDSQQHINITRHFLLSVLIVISDIAYYWFIIMAAKVVAARHLCTLDFLAFEVQATARI